MRLGVIGRGPWGNVYVQTLRRLGIEYWQAGRNDRWHNEADGVIIATAAHSHYEIAQEMIQAGVPVLIEKPVCLSSDDARALLHEARSAIVFVGHTRLYSSAWREFKAKALAAGVKSVSAVAGGPCNLEPLWDWGPHLVAMCLDLGFDPLAAKIVTGREEHPLTVIVNGDISYIDRPEDRPRPLEVLLTEFMAAIEKGEPDIRGLELGVKVVEALEKIENRERVAHGA